MADVIYTGRYTARLAAPGTPLCRCGHFGHDTDMNGECLESGCKCRKFKGVPNKPRTPLRNVRVDDKLWGDAQFIASAIGENLSAIIRDALRDFVEENESILVDEFVAEGRETR